jgi:hypothetical protein
VCSGLLVGAVTVSVLALACPGASAAASAASPAASPAPEVR